jgi:hypothetical protein
VGDWIVVLEDDAILPIRFQEHVRDVLSVIDKPVVVNFYASLQNHRKYADWCRDKKYGSFYRAHYSGSVGVAMPVKLVPAFIEKFKAVRGYPDIRCDVQVSIALRRLAIPVYYTYPSLVDHNNFVSIIQKRDNSRRKAICYVGDYDKPIEWKL